MPLGPHVAKVASRYALMTGRLVAEPCESVGEVIVENTAVLITTTDMVTADLFDYLFVSSECAATAPGLIFESTVPELAQRLNYLANQLLQPIHGNAVEIYPYAEFNDISVGMRRMVGGSASRATLKDAITTPAAILTLVAHSNGFDLDVGSGLVLCNAGSSNDVPRDAGAPCCRTTKHCFRLNTPVGEASMSGSIISPEQVGGSIILLCACTGLLVRDGSRHWGFAAPMMGPSSKAVALITSWSPMMPRMEDLEAILRRLYAGCTLGESIAGVVTPSTTTRLALIGDPEVRLVAYPPEVVESVRFSQRNSDATADDGSVSFLQVLTFAAMLDTKLQTQSLARAANHEARLLELQLARGFAGNEETDHSQGLRSAMIAFIEECPTPLYHYWTPLASSVEVVRRLSCNFCGSVSEILEFHLRLLRLPTRILEICGQCGIRRDTPSLVEFSMTYSRGTFNLHGDRVVKRWAARLHIRSQDPNHSVVMPWPKEDSGLPSASFMPAFAAPPGPLFATLTLLRGTQLNVLAIPFDNTD